MGLLKLAMLVLSRGTIFQKKKNASRPLHTGRARAALQIRSSHYALCSLKCAFQSRGENKHCCSRSFLACRSANQGGGLDGSNETRAWSCGAGWSRRRGSDRRRESALVSRRQRGAAPRVSARCGRDGASVGQSAGGGGCGDSGDTARQMPHALCTSGKSGRDQREVSGQWVPGSPCMH